MIGVLDYSIKQLERIFKEEIDKEEEFNTDLNAETIDTIINILSDNELKDLLKNISDSEYYKKLDYKQLVALTEVISKIHEKLQEVKNNFDVEQFLREGNVLDIEELKREYKINKKVKEAYPNLDIQYLADIYKSPPKTLKVQYSNDVILIDSFVFRKYVIAILQMVFNEMDLVVCFTGGEGTGKSMKVSQDMYMVYWILYNAKIIEYSYNIKDMFFNSISSLQEAEDKYFHEKFRIFGLDEGNELNRQNWKDEKVQTFFQRLRRERFNQRIKFICLPVVGEMITNIILSRLNFIFEMQTDNITKSGLLKKGVVEMYIIPRGEKIYSPHQKRDLYKSEIKSILYENLKDKSYLTGIPREILIKRFKCNGVWGFKHSDYIKYLKETNETFSINKGLSASEWELYCIYRSNISLKAQGISHKEWNYHTTAKFLNKVNNYFEKNPDLLNKYRAIEERKKG